MRTVGRHGLRLPLLVHFPSVLRSHVRQVGTYFTGTVTHCGCDNICQNIFPIGYGRRQRLLRSVIHFNGPCRFNLRTNSGPRLVVTLTALSAPNTLLVYGNCGSGSCVRATVLKRHLKRRPVVIVRRVDRISLTVTTDRQLGVHPILKMQTGLDAGNDKH